MEVVLQSVRAWYQVSLKRKALLLLALSSPVLALIQREIRLAVFRRIFSRSTPANTTDIIALINHRADAIESLLQKQSRMISRLDKAVQGASIPAQPLFIKPCLHNSRSSHLNFMFLIDLAHRDVSPQDSVTANTPTSAQIDLGRKPPTFAAELLKRASKPTTTAGKSRQNHGNSGYNPTVTAPRRAPAFAAELLRVASTSTGGNGQGRSSVSRKKLKRDSENIGSVANLNGGKSLFDQITRVKLKKTKVNRSPGGTPTPTKGGKDTSPSLARNAGEYLELALKRKFDNTMTTSSPNPHQVRKRAEHQPHLSPSNWPREKRRV